MAKGKRYVVRTVKNGAVRIGGKVFRPRDWHMEYDGRLEGERLAFGRYEEYSEGGPVWAEFVSLLSTEDGREPPIINGAYYWMFWYTDAEWQKRVEIAELMDKANLEGLPI